MEQDIAILISNLRQRKPAACQQILTEYGPAVFRMVQRIVTRREDAEEVYQDVFVKALRGIEGYNPRQASLATWLGRIAYHESLNFVRGKKPHIVSMDDRAAGIDTLELPDDPPPDGHDLRARLRNDGVRRDNCRLHLLLRHTGLLRALLNSKS